MSLVPYSIRDSREVVLRHNNAIVLRDPKTKQLVLRGADSPSHCPTCLRAFQDTSEPGESPHRAAPFISPEYFRMLQSVIRINNEENSSSQIHRLADHDYDSPIYSTGNSVTGTETFTSTPASVKAGYSIKKDAFCPNYFTKFFIEEMELGRGGQFACKRVPVGDDHTWLEKVLIEVQLLQGLSHPNLVSYRHVWLEDVKLSRFGPSVPCAFILQQYCNSGDLLHYIVGPTPEVKSAKEQMKEQLRKRSRSQAKGERPNQQFHRRKLAFEEIFSFFKDIASGLAHLHASNYIHRDLKPSNCLLHQDGNEIRCLISDFGEVQAENVARKSTGSTGTISYCAPEVLKQDLSGRYANFTTKSDIFSLGMILYFMCFGRLPYKSADSVEEEFEDITLLRAEICSWSGLHDERRERPDLPNQLYVFLKRLLATDPSERPSANDILVAIRTEKGLGDLPRARNSNNPSSLSGRILPSREVSVPFCSPEKEASDQVRSGTFVEKDVSMFNSQTVEPISNSQLVVKPLNSLPHSQITSQDRNYDGNNRQETSSIPNSASTPLLMPPPSSKFSALCRAVCLYKIRAQLNIGIWLTFSTRIPNSVIKFLVFMVKLWSLMEPCSPRLVRSSVWWPLMVLSAFELAIRRKISWKLLLTTTTAHFIVMGIAILLGGGIIHGLCGREE
ncbi:calcium-dependent protein kinase [Blumeria hordei DH14]|uniref:Calcium-dependent protein kinase n=1 Tax=Blumeria graminis f. sp. hordei (strain DH14) TaxID=546991 RepID=N1JML0_BLUG1|nr:calcium-dependent protein kinase [Blumeria hordei DH14]